MALWAVRSAQAQDVPPAVLQFLRRHEEETVLTSPKKIIVSNPREYLSQIKVGRDGLIVKNGFYSGLLLPQVPIEYGWNEEEFLEYTCQKAGLSKNEWKNTEIEIQKFEGIVFKEEYPNGPVIREVLED